MDLRWKKKLTAVWAVMAILGSGKKRMESKAVTGSEGANGDLA